MKNFEELISGISTSLWSVFLPLVIVSSIYLAIKFFGTIQKETTKKSKLKVSQIVGPVAVSLGAMIGTGAIIGVLGSVASLHISGQNYTEAIVGWALVGALVLLPIAYIETVVAKTTKMAPKQYIGKFLNTKLATIYAVCFATMYILGFGGFQFQGINSTVSILTDNFLNTSVTTMQSYLFIAVPLLIIVSIVVLTKKHKLFINVMAYFIGIAVVLYLMFLAVFVFKTSDYLPTFFSNMVEGMANPMTSMIGIPVGMIISFQRIIQTSEPGLGGLAMSSLESDSEPRAAGIISLGTSTLTIFIAVFTTSYITSYGYANGWIDLSNADSYNLLQGFFLTGWHVAGVFGVIIMLLFTILSAITTLLGSFYYLNVLFKMNENMQIAIYIGILFIASILATFGGGIIFEVVDLLIFVVTGINVLALLVYNKNGYKEYKLKK